MIKGRSTDHEILTSEVKKLYAEVALKPNKGFHFIHGRPLIEELQYDRGLLDGIPEGAVESFSGVGNPFQMANGHMGERVLDIGSGAGMDTLIAARYTGRSGMVFGLDLTPEMVEKARENASHTDIDNVTFMEADVVEEVPFVDRSMDLVISNGVLYMCDDKESVLKNIFNVLKPGGRLLLADVIIQKPVPQSSTALMHLWTRCIAGALMKDEYQSQLKSIGFEQVEFKSSFNVFAGSPKRSPAILYRPKGHNIFAKKG